ncbi:MAG TPA: hypothetical protein VKQ32_01600 [Polyangia bacterium]|nr:hypothetical protein [Polyangia bacterium]
MTNATLRRPRAAWPIILAFAAVAGAGRAARADEPAAAPASGETRWYGWETMASDGTAIALWAAAAYLGDAKYTSGSFQTYQDMANLTAILGVGAYVLGGPVLHAQRGNWNSFGGSLVVRLGLPAAGILVGVLAGAAACGPGIDDEVPCPVVGGMLGVAAGALAAMIVDSAVLAREPVERDRGASVQPLVVPTSGGASFALAGRF